MMLRVTIMNHQWLLGAPMYQSYVYDNYDSDATVDDGSCSWLSR